MIFQRQRCTEQRHDPVAHDLIDGALIAVNRFHHSFQHRVEQLARFLGISIRQ